MELKGKVTLVTGGSKRVGKAIALALAGRGADVGITFRSSEGEARETVRQIREMGVRAFAVQCDQRDPEAVAVTVEKLRKALGPVDVLVNNAAAFNRTPFVEATLEDWDLHLETNLRGPWLFCKAVGPEMKERGGGAIVNMVDIAAERPFPAYLPYSISKAGLAALTRGLARALAPEVRVNGIAPGVALWPEDYPAAQKEAFLARVPLDRPGTPEDIAAAVLYLVEGGEYVTGVVLPVDGGRGVV